MSATGTRTTSTARPRTRRLTVAQALITFLTRQYTERDGERHRLIDAVWGIFGHGNVAGVGQALVEAHQGGLVVGADVAEAECHIPRVGG